jgi:hypothetical protein
MARVDTIKKNLGKSNIDENLIKEITSGGNIIDVISRMEKLLDPELTHSILDSHACGTSVREINDIKKIEAGTLRGKIEKIAGLEDFHKDWNVSLSPDKTLTAGWILRENDNYICVCSAPVKKGVKVSDIINGDRVMPITYCYCCAGHCRKHLQKLFDIELKTIEIVSSPINSKGRKPCEFIFEIL